MSRFSHALVLGKFYPFHAGHQALVRAALAESDRVTVQVQASHVESVPPEVRAAWVAEEHPTAHVVWGWDDHPVDFDSPAAWDAHMEVVHDLLDAPVDAVFTSDAYGAELARRLSATWRRVDAGRVATPVSGTAVRADVAGHWWALAPGVRAWFARRVAVVGAESTGTTTLARALAEHYGVPCVPEYGRTWSEVRPGGLAAPWHSLEFDLIADRHQAAERDALRRTPRPLAISDTDVLATAIWHERYVGTRHDGLWQRAAAWRPDLYVLTGDEIPWVDDGMRDGEHVRAGMQERFREALADQDVPWLEVRGPHDVRLARAVTATDALLAGGWDLADPLG